LAQPISGQNNTALAEWHKEKLARAPQSLAAAKSEVDLQGADRLRERGPRAAAQKTGALRE
jgi:hypothetical protein